MAQKPIYFQQNVFRFDLQKCLSPVPTVSNEVIQARRLNGNSYSSLRDAVESELRNLKKNIISGLVFIGNIQNPSELEENYTGNTGDYRYCLADGLYYAWNGSAWIVCGDSSRVADGSITPQKTSFIVYDEHPNLISDNTVIRGAELNGEGYYDMNGDYDTLMHGIPVKGGQTYCFSINGDPVYVDKALFKTANDLRSGNTDTFVSLQNNVGFDAVTAPQDAKFMFISLATWNGDLAEITVQESNVIQAITRETALSDRIKVPHCLKSNLYDMTMMTLGDSMSESGEWQDYVKEYTGLRSIINLAVNEMQINHFADNVTEENIQDVDIVFVMGLYDSFLSPTGTVDDEADNAENASVCAGYKYIVEKLYSLKPSIQIVLASPHRPQANDISEKAKAVGMVASYYGIPFIDLYNTAGFNEHTYSLYQRDAVHSSSGKDGGYEREAKAIAGGLINYFG